MCNVGIVAEDIVVLASSALLRHVPHSTAETINYGLGYSSASRAADGSTATPAIPLCTDVDAQSESEYVATVESSLVDLDELDFNCSR